MKNIRSSRWISNFFPGRGSYANSHGANKNEGERQEPIINAVLKWLGLFSATIASLIIIVLVWLTNFSGSVLIEPFRIPDNPKFNGSAFTSRLAQKLSDLASQTNGNEFTDLASELSSSDEINLQIYGANLQLDKVLARLNRAIGNVIQIAGELYEDGDAIGVVIQINGRPVPLDRKYKNIEEAIDGTALTILATTHPLRFAKSVVANVGNKSSVARSKLLLSDSIEVVRKLKVQSSEKKKPQFVVAESFLLQESGRLDEATQSLLEASSSEKNLDALFWAELTARAYFAGRIERAFIAASRAANSTKKLGWNPYKRKSYKAKVAFGNYIYEKLNGDFENAGSIAFGDYAKNETDSYENLDVRWVGITDYIRAGNFKEAERQRRILENEIYGYVGGKRKYVEGPAEYQMWVAIVQKNWDSAYTAAEYVLKIHNCAEPLKEQQGISVHGPWINYLASRAGVVQQKYKFEDYCEICNELEAHRIIFESKANADALRKGISMLNVLKDDHPKYDQYKSKYNNAIQLEREYSIERVDDFFLRSFTSVSRAEKQDAGLLKSYSKMELDEILWECVMNSGKLN